MQLWRLEPLKSLLVAGPLPDREAVKYVAAQSAIVAAVVVPTPGQDLPPWWHFVAAPAIAIAGVYFCYKQNGGAAGRGFAERYFSIGWVVAVRIAVVSVALGCVGSIIVIGIVNPGISDDVGARLVEIAGYGLMVLAFWRTGVHLADVVHRTTGHPSEGLHARDA